MGISSAQSFETRQAVAAMQSIEFETSREGLGRRRYSRTDLWLCI